MKHIDLYTPSGIGDIYWILMKLARKANEVGRKIRIHCPPGADIKMARGKFLEFIDCVESVAPDGIPYERLIQKAQSFGHYPALADEMFCECNTWLESGERLELYMPAFPTEFALNWQIDPESIRRATSFLNPSMKNIVIYTSGRMNNMSKSVGRWSIMDWRKQVAQVRAMPDVNLIWIGAQYDADILPDLKRNFEHILIDETADVILSLLRLCDGFVSYQSGLSVISVCEQVPTYMLYFRKIEKLTHTFNPPEGEYQAAFFDEVPNFSGWIQKLPLRPVLARGVQKRDYTFWVNDNIEQTEKDWIENPQGHQEQYETIKDLQGSVLEVGCGSGCLAQHITNKYLGFDQSEKLLRLARAKNPDKKFVTGNIREIPANWHSDHVCAFGFMKHFSLSEWDEIFGKLAAVALKTLTIETPIRDEEWEDVEHDFPHVFVSEARVWRDAELCGFKVLRVSENSAKEFTYRMERINA